MIAGVLYALVASAWMGSPLSVMVAFGLAALICAEHRQWGWAGGLAGMAAICEPGGMIPLVLVMLLAIHSPTATRSMLRVAAVPALVALVSGLLIAREPPAFPLAALMALIPMGIAALFAVVPVYLHGRERRLQPFVTALVAWGAFDTLIRAALLGQPVSLAIVPPLAVLAGIAVARVLPIRTLLVLVSGGACLLALATFNTNRSPSADLRWPKTAAYSAYPATPVAFAYGPDLTLISVSIMPRIELGRPSHLTLDWIARAVPTAPLSIQIDAISRDGHSVTLGRDTVDVGATGRFTTQHTLTMPVDPSIAPGLYAVYVTVNYRAARLGQVQVGRVVVPLGARPVQDPPLAILPAGATLLRPTIRIQDQTLLVELTWTSAGALDHDYKVFLHLEDSAHHIAAQYDADVQDGNYPTSLWQPGDVIPQTVALALAGLPPGEYTLTFGMYNQSFGRLGLRVCDTQTVDSLRLATIQVAQDRTITISPQRCADQATGG